MTEELRILEQRWRDTRDIEDDKRYLLALVASGKLDKARVEMAAALGHAGAQATGAVRGALPEHYRSKVETAVSLLTDREAVSFSLDCASRLLAAWESVRPDDSRPRKALEATRRWLLGQVTEDLLATAGRAAADAGTEADDPNQVPANSVLTAALNASASTCHAALAAENAARRASAQKTTIGGVNGCAAWTTKFAIAASAEPEAERKWQLNRLADYLLDRAKPAALPVHRRPHPRTGHPQPPTG